MSSNSFYSWSSSKFSSIVQLLMASIGSIIGLFGTWGSFIFNVNFIYFILFAVIDIIHLLLIFRVLLILLFSSTLVLSILLPFDRLMLNYCSYQMVNKKAICNSIAIDLALGFSVYKSHLIEPISSYLPPLQLLVTKNLLVDKINEWSLNVIFRAYFVSRS